MSDVYERYAIYWVPAPPDPLAAFGCRWTGWCAEDGTRGERDGWPGAAGFAPEITAGLRRHGLHGALLAPFRLSGRHGRFALESVVEAVAARRIAPALPPLVPEVLGGRVALVARPRSAAIEALAVAFRTAIAPGISAKAFADAPTVVPGVDARAASAARPFHVPLTDVLAPGEAEALLPALARLVDPLLAQPRRIADVALMGDPGGGRPLRLLERFPLRGEDADAISGALPVRGADLLADDVADLDADDRIATA